MVYYLDNKRIFFIPILHKKLGKGSERYAYLYKGKVLKINVKFSSTILDANTVDYMKRLDSDRIFLPREKLTTIIGKYAGFTKDFVENSDLDKLFELDVFSFLEELYALRRELDYLSKHFIAIFDWLRINTMYDGKIRLIDPGKYSYFPNDGTYVVQENIFKYNIFVLNDYF